MSKNVAIVGATGAVGRTMLSILEKRAFPVADLRLFASARSAGQMVDTTWGSVAVEDLATADPSGVEIALFSAGAARSREFAPDFVEAGAVVVDNSSAFRKVDEIPLVVAGVNDHAIARHAGIVANPNCTTMTLMMGVGPLHAAAGLRAMTAMSYQSVSGSGMAAIAELERQNRALGADPEALMNGGWDDPGSEVYARPIAWNVLPFAGNLDEAGYTDEEWKLVNETRKILEAPQVAVEPTCVRVPVMVGHGISASCWFDRPMAVDEAIELISNAPGAEVWLDKVPTPLDAAGIDEVLVGRIRPTLGEGGGINLWTVGDNLRKGAALNTIEIAEQL